MSRGRHAHRYGDEFREALQRRGLTISRAARHIDCDASHLYRVLAGARPLTPSIAERLTRLIRATRSEAATVARDGR